MISNDRYVDEPLLRFLDCYVLWAIGQLEESEELKMQAAAPKLNELFGIRGDWREIITQAMELPDDLPEIIRETWEQNQKTAQEHDITLPPEAFAIMFVDQNLTADPESDS